MLSRCHVYYIHYFSLAFWDAYVNTRHHIQQLQSVEDHEYKHKVVNQQAQPYNATITTKSIVCEQLQSIRTQTWENGGNDLLHVCNQWIISLHVPHWYNMAG